MVQYGLRALELSFLPTLLLFHVQFVCCRWRSEQLLDRPQASSNEVYYVLSRRLNIREVQQPPDIDILLPTLKTGVFLEGKTLSPFTSLQLASTGRHRQQNSNSDEVQNSPGRRVAMRHEAMKTMSSGA